MQRQLTDRARPKRNKLTPDMNSDFLKVIISSYRDLSKGRQRVVLLALFLLPVIFFISLLYLPGLNRIQALTIQQQPLKTQLALMKRQAARQPQLQAELDVTRGLFKKATQTLPDSDEIPALLDSVASLGSAAGLEFLLFEPGDEKPRDFYIELPIAVQFKSGYHQAGRFYEAVAALPRLVNFTAIEMVPDKEGSQLLTTCTANTYRYLQAMKVPNTPEGSK